MANQVFGSQCPPRSALFARDLVRDLRHGKQRVSEFYHVLFHLFHIEVRAVMRETCFDLLRTGRFSYTLRVTGVTANNGFLRSIMIWVWIWLA